MAWSIEEVVRMTGVTSRTLRHYQAIGLLEPAFVTDGGRRHYGEAELLRLQEVLLLRDLGLRLSDIASALSGAEERVAALERHAERLVEERDRVTRLIATVGRTVRRLKEGESMNPKEMFDGLVKDPYEPEARERWGDEAVEESYRRVAALPQEERRRLASGEGWREVHARFAELAAQGASADDPRVQSAVREHISLVRLAWDPNREAYLGLADLYLADERFARNIGDEATVGLLTAAMRIFAERELS